MILFHFHTAQRDYKRLRIKKGHGLCHVFSSYLDDKEILEELTKFAIEIGFDPEWIDKKNKKHPPHLDVFGRHLNACSIVRGTIISRSEVLKLITDYRTHGTD